MKHIKSAAALMLCALMAVSLVLPAFAVEVIDRAQASFTLPQADDEILYGDISVAAPGEYGAMINDVYYYSGKLHRNIHPAQGELYEGGITYTVCVLFFTQPGYALQDGKTEYYVNGKPAPLSSTEQNTVEVLVKIEPKSDGDDTPDEPEEPGFFQRIIAKIREIIDKIRYFLFPRV